MPIFVSLEVSALAGDSGWVCSLDSRAPVTWVYLPHRLAVSLQQEKA